MIVLGAKVEGDPAKPSKILQERLDQAVSFLRNNHVKQVIVSGGQGEDETEPEAKVMKHYLMDQGISESLIQTEAHSSRTAENLLNSKTKFALGKTVIITSDYHMYRALLLAKRAEIDASGSPAKTKSDSRFRNYVREAASISYGLFFDR
ncbi:hypothetical protein MFLO_02748 [Listeria floridensis FSL S10-1187]|uniref:DUF218 domain-containing protein n=1 Tax=Listeria floridensis FSL S10-1187 TaxID=1265817 RepID=A0ABN0RHQ1_9LIST|nr:YdcF family protein [Listeria floridensis]EUJ33434.1 hypothetical protein MFLO_02748 [Listeria floridensis FSL S10-1187]